MARPDFKWMQGCKGRSPPAGLPDPQAGCPILGTGNGIPRRGRRGSKALASHLEHLDQDCIKVTYQLLNLTQTALC